MNRQTQIPTVIPGLESLPVETFLREYVVRYYSGNISKSTLRRWIAQGRLPQPRKLTERTYVWLAGELREALAKLASSGEV